MLALTIRICSNEVVKTSSFDWVFGKSIDELNDVSVDVVRTLVFVSVVTSSILIRLDSES